MPLVNVRLIEGVFTPAQKQEIIRKLTDVTPASTERSSQMRFILTAAAMFVLANVPGRLLAEPAKPGSQPTSKVTLYNGLGKHTRPVATSNPEAQKFFDQGLNFMYAFNHDEAVRAFRRAAELDPDCAMAYWGISLSMGKNYNYPLFPPEKAKAAWKALESARAKANAESEANRALVEALAARYADPLPKETRPLEEAYAKAMKAVWEKFPKDADIGALYAESLMNLRPWDLWTIDGKPQPETPEILKVLQAVVELDPKHPLANHLYIHACEASPNPEKADAAADRLRDLQPALGHMVHMPSHIDIRRGRWQAAIEANDRAITADRNYAKTVPEQGFYRMYMAHNHHMLAFAAMMQGESKRALTAVRDMLADVPKDWVALPENAAIADGFVAAPLEVMKRFGQWDEILKEPAPPEIFPIARAMRHHIRAIAYAAKGETAKAREEQKAFREAAKKPAKDATFGNNKATDLFAVGDDMLEGEILVREGKMEAGIKALRAAVAKEDKLRYSEPPDWVVPVRHALGAFLLKDGQATEAEAVYREDLRRWPDNGWSLFGLAASLETQGKKAEAAAVRAKFDEIWKHADVKLPSSCFCQK
jgi:tetratricopeptide (TPR) repeat protein